MTTQSNVQGLLEGGVGLQNNAQSGVPSGVNNGNPNTAYNWSSYIPSIIRGAGGQPTGANFNLITSQPAASSPGYTPPFTADPFAAMLMSQLAQYRGPSASQLPGYGQGNSMIDTILHNLITGYVAPHATTPATGSTGTSPIVTTPPTTTTPPVTTPSTGTVVPSAGSGLNGGMLEAGPSTMPGTTLPNGTTANLNAAIGNAIGQLPSNGGGNNSAPVMGGGNTGGSFTVPTFGTGANGSAGTNFSQNPVGSGYDFSTGNTATNNGSSTIGNIAGNASSGFMNSIAPSNATPGGWFQDFISTMANRAGVGGVWDGVDGNLSINPTTGLATIGTGGANVLAGTINQGINGGINGAVNGTPANSLGGFNMNGTMQGSGMPGVDGLPQGNWNINDTYTPPSYDFSNLSTGNAPSTVDANFDPVAYLDQQRAAEGTSTPATGSGSTGAPVAGAVGAGAAIGQLSNGAYTSGPYSGMTEQAVRNMMQTQTAFQQMQMAQEHARLQAELQATMSKAEH